MYPHFMRDRWEIKYLYYKQVCSEINEFDFLLIFLGSKIHVARSSNIFFLHPGWSSCVPSLETLHHLVSAFLLRHLSSSYPPHYTPATDFCLNFQVCLSLWAFAVAVPSSLSCPSCFLRGWLLLVNSGLIFNVSSSEKLSMATPSKAAIQPLSLTLPDLILWVALIIIWYFVCLCVYGPPSAERIGARYSVRAQ